VGEALGERRGLRTALRRALRLAEGLDHPRERDRSRALYRSIAVLYGLLGHEEDAQEWFGRSHRCAPDRASSDTMSLNDTLRAALSYLSGNYVNTIRLVNNALNRHSRRSTDRHRNLLIVLLGGSYLRLGQISKAALCVDAIQKNHAPVLEDFGWILSLLLAGEIQLGLVLRSVPSFRGQLLFVDDWAPDGLDVPGRIRLAQEAFAQAADRSKEDALLLELAQSGLVRARLAIEPLEADWDWQRRHLQRMGEEGLVHARDLARLNLAVLYLVHDRASEARLWLAPIAQTALRRPGTPFEHDILFCAARAAELSGDSHQALVYLSEYNVRIQAQKLSRAPLPAPNLEAQSEIAAPVDERRGFNRDDVALISRVTALVRDHPSNPTQTVHLAAMEGISRRTLEYKLRRLTGKSPREFVSSIRLELAYESLRNQGAQEPGMLTTLAKSLGFKNYRTFARAFRKAYGLSPAQAAKSSVGFSLAGLGAAEKGG
jgi:AraC-like DNA-binding protein